MSKLQGYPHNQTVSRALQETLNKANTRIKPELSSILMFSGGLDSVVLLAKILEETDQKLHVHHIELVNIENRAEAENDAITKVLAYCKEHYRPFTYTTSRHEFNHGLGGGLDITLAMFTAGRLTCALGGVIDIVYTGHVAVPCHEIAEAAAAYNACFTNRRFKPEWLRPLSHVRKVAIYESIPEELAEMSWSCRKPEYSEGKYSPCGKCHACHTIEKIHKERASYAVRA